MSGELKSPCPNKENCGNTVKPYSIDVATGKIDYRCGECGREWSLAAGEAYGEGPPPPVQTVDYLYVQLPTDLRHVPRYWDPKLAYELGHLQQEAMDFTLLDWAHHRRNVNVIADELSKFNVKRHVVVWGGPETYRYLQQLVPFLENYVVVGYSKKLGKSLGLPVSEGITDIFRKSLPRPHLDLFDVGYFSHSALPFTIDTQMWQRRIPIRFRFKRSVRPRLAGEILRSLKMKYGYDSLDWIDDVTARKEWTLKLLEEMHRVEVAGNIQFICRAKYHRIDPGLLRELREAGCKVVDYGEIPVSLHGDPITSQRLQGAMVETRKHEMFPSFTYILDHEAKISDCKKATEFMISFDGLHRPQLEKKYEGATAKQILAMNHDTWNPTLFDDVRALGLLEAMGMGWLDALR